MKHTYNDNFFNNEKNSAGELICTLCGSPGNHLPYKKGCICQNCLKYVRSH